MSTRERVDTLGNALKELACAGRRIVKIASALSMPREVVDHLTAHRCYAMALGDEIMDLLNFAAIGEDT